MKNRRSQNSFSPLANRGERVLPVGRRNIRQPILDQPKFTIALRRWLFQEKVSYATAQARLQQRFGLKSNSGSLCAWWQRESARRLAARCPSARQIPPNPVLLDVVLQSTRPVRLRILQNHTRLRFQPTIAKQLALPDLRKTGR